MVVAAWQVGEVFVILLLFLDVLAYLIALRYEIGQHGCGDAQRAGSATAPPSVRWDRRHEGGRQPWVFSIR